MTRSDPDDRSRTAFPKRGKAFGIPALAKNFAQVLADLCAVGRGRPSHLRARATSNQSRSAPPAGLGSLGRPAGEWHAGPLSCLGVPVAKLPVRPHVSAVSGFLPAAGVLVQPTNCGRTLRSGVFVPAGEAADFCSVDGYQSDILCSRQWAASIAALRHAAALPQSLDGDRRLAENGGSARGRYGSVPRLPPYRPC